MGHGMQMIDSFNISYFIFHISYFDTFVKISKNTNRPHLKKQPNFDKNSISTLKKHPSTIISFSQFMDHMRYQQRAPRPQIRLQLHPSRIALNPAQTQRMKHINDQILTLKHQLQADDVHVDVDKLVNDIDVEIEQLRQRLDEVRQEVRDHQSTIKNLRKANSMPFQDLRQIRDEIREMVRRRDDIHVRLQELASARAAFGAKIDDVHKRYGIRSIEEGLRKVDRIDDEIERETFTNSQLNRKLKDKNRIEAGITVLKRIGEFGIGNGVGVLEEEHGLREELRQISVILREDREDREAVHEELEEVSVELDDHRSQLWQLRKLMRDLEKRLEAELEQKRCLISGMKMTRSSRRRIHEDVDRLEYEKMEIFAEAEVTTLQMIEEHRRMKAARSLSEYLDKLEIDAAHGHGHGHETGRGISSGRGENESGRESEEMALIATLRKGTKKGKRLAKRCESARECEAAAAAEAEAAAAAAVEADAEADAEAETEGQLRHDLGTLKLFEIVEIVPPKSIQQIPATRDVLHGKFAQLTLTAVKDDSPPAIQRELMEDRFSFSPAC
jgi:hypothetical protein